MSYSLHMPHWPKPLMQALGIPAARTRRLLAKLGHPERTLPPVIHVGGTKGKGSTIAFLRAMLEAAGYRVHVYSSPHIDRFNERIVLAGQEIDDTTLYEVLEQTRAAAGDEAYGFFDATTAAAVLAFSRCPADIMLMEMGLGGAVDATNFIDSPLLTILTTVSYDHMEIMGDTLDSIARFESGLLKPGTPCIVSYQPEEARAVIEQKALATNTPLYSYGTDWKMGRGEDSMQFIDSHGMAELPLPALLGAHQIVNAGNAIAAISALEAFDVSGEHIVQGLQKARWKGRLEKLTPSGLPKPSELWFDGGHNLAAAQAIAAFAREQWSDKPLYLIVGTTRGKDITSLITPFAGLVKRVYGVEVKSEPMSYPADAITEAALSVMPARSAVGIAEALDDIKRNTAEPFRALVFGSLYLWLEAIEV